MNWSCFAALSVVFATALSACSTTESGGVAYDSNAETTIVTGRQTTIQPLAGPVRTYFLKAEISPGQTDLYLVVLYLSVNGWLSAGQVSDSDGQTIQGFRGADESFDIKYGRVTKEIYYIPLTRRYLEQHRNSGIDFRLRGATGTLVATQPAAFVQGFLASLDSTQKRLAGEVIVKKLISESAKNGSGF
jgi:hypothetical protein